MGCEAKSRSPPASTSLRAGFDFARAQAGRQSGGLCGLSGGLRWLSGVEAHGIWAGDRSASTPLSGRFIKPKNGSWNLVQPLVPGTVEAWAAVRRSPMGCEAKSHSPPASTSLRAGFDFAQAQAGRQSGGLRGLSGVEAHGIWAGGRSASTPLSGRFINPKNGSWNLEQPLVPGRSKHSCRAALKHSC